MACLMIDPTSLELADHETVCMLGHVHNKHLSLCPMCADGYIELGYVLHEADRD